MSRRLLLIACSSRKLRTKGLLPAIQRYDGVTYRVIRKAMREGYFPKDVDIKILSAEFGLIEANTPIPYYDQQMDKRRAIELRPYVQGELKRLISKVQYAEIFINMGKVYLLAVDGFVETTRGYLLVKHADGGVGSKSKSMKLWLLACYKAQ